MLNRALGFLVVISTVLGSCVYPAHANPPITWGGSVIAQLFPTITKMLLGNGWSIVPTRAFFGDCSDGNVTVSVNTTLTHDMFYNNLTVNSSALLNTAGWRVFVCGTLDVTNPGFILNGGNSGTTPGGGGAGGTGGGNGSVGTLYRSLGGANAGAGSATAGANGTTATSAATLIYTGGTGGAGGNGGAGNAGAGGTGGGTNTPTATYDMVPSAAWYLPLLGDATPITVSIGGSGGGGGGGSVQSGAGGGGGGAGGGPVYVAANIISTGASTSLGVIQSGGGAGGNGGTPTGTCTAGCGGGGGGGGGAGGWVVVKYNTHIGTSVFLTYAGGGTGGTGGAGKNGGGTGTNGVTGANGIIYQIDMSTGTLTTYTGGLGAL